MSPRREVRVAVAGLGNVGAEAVRLIQARKRAFSERLGGRLTTTWVCSRRAAAVARRLKLPKSVKRTKDWRDLVSDPNVDVIVELYGGDKEAKKLVIAALRAGKHVITANKHLLAQHWPEIAREARKARRSVYFEAAVASAIPIVQALRDGLAADRVTSVTGIFNGTTNFVLSKMAHEGGSVSEIVKEAQRLGMAERDPTMDLNGMDTAHKVSVTASLLSGGWLPADKIARVGLEGVHADDMIFAVHELGRTIRLLGTVRVDHASSPARVEAHVQPTLVPLDHPLAAVHGGYNAALVEADSAGDLMFYGKGAGPGPAAGAVLADLLALGREILGGAEAFDLTGGRSGGASAMLKPLPESPAPYYIRLQVKDRPGELAKITGALGREGVSISKISQASRSRAAASVMILTHPSARKDVERAVKAVLKFASVSKSHSLLRLLP